MGVPLEQRGVEQPAYLARESGLDCQEEAVGLSVGLARVGWGGGGGSLRRKGGVRGKR